eukprot:CAMPEP_0174713182 /NCGR_PEP_ID=MMETSP1094-20130205/13946_1 /TAXON_ID=156173 /ORGANISM="Chrysochromulina brevifilum, Strain UTEX LB 985" /LENGTH=104 /DNA_ID=CAMNT_0015912343 /DNA_START=599 /DNA_END=913 /DNA_ORIENTATION=+
MASAPLGFGAAKIDTRTLAAPAVMPPPVMPPTTILSTLLGLLALRSLEKVLQPSHIVATSQRCQAALGRTRQRAESHKVLHHPAAAAQCATCVRVRVKRSKGQT